MSTSSDSISAPATIDESLVGRMIGKYEIVGILGRGGMGTVYEALNTTIGKRVAMKFVDAELSRNRDAVARFQREAQAASSVESAHIVQIFDSGTSEDNLPFIVMELLRGEDLGHRIKRCGRLDLAEAIHVIAQILRGLHRAHQAGIVHRDLKPDNIFLVDRDDDPNFAKILDFGISKVQRRGDVPAHTLTRQGTVLGTPFYMSPEQAQALGDIDGRADLWSVGAILFESLTGRPPHGGGTYEQVIIAICTRDVDDVRAHNPGVPEPIAQVIAKAMRRERDDRFPSARAFLDALIAGSGGLLSARAGRTSGDEAISGPGVATTPSAGVARRTKEATPHADEAAGYAPTLDVRHEATSRIGWSTSGRTARKRGLRLYVTIGAASLALGAVGAFALDGGDEAASSAAASPPQAPPLDVTVQLRSNVPSARFVVDGAVAPGGALRGPPGEVRQVRIEAEGYAPIERAIALDPATATVTIELVAAAPVVDPGPPAPEPSATAPAAAAKTRPTTHTRPATAPPGAATPPTPSAKPAPQPTGVAGGLQLKEE